MRLGTMDKRSSIYPTFALFLLFQLPFYPLVIKLGCIPDCLLDCILLIKLAVDTDQRVGYT